MYRTYVKSSRLLRGLGLCCSMDAATGLGPAVTSSVTVMHRRFRNPGGILFLVCRPTGSNPDRDMRIGNGKSASVELFKVLSPLGRKTRYSLKWLTSQRLIDG